MIVDMVRNDLGRIAEVGTVEVPELFTVERYPNVWQMTSLVTARSTASLADLFAALHPSASVTGAPKVRTMEILRELEDGPRGVYTGAVGYVAPGRHGPIQCRDSHGGHRSPHECAHVRHRQRHRLGFGRRGGVRRVPLEGIDPWPTAGGVRPSRDDAVDCATTGSICASGTWRACATRPSISSSATTRLPFGRPSKRLTRRSGRASNRPPIRSGGCVCSCPGRVGFAPRKARSTTPGQLRCRWFWRGTRSMHATGSCFTKRPIARRIERARSAVEPSCDEVILWNSRRQVTEATTANLVVDLDGRLVTPPVECGLLGGTLRGDLLAKGEVREETVSIEQLCSSRRFWLVNSLRGWREARLVQSGQVGQVGRVGQVGQVGRVGKA